MRNRGSRAEFTRGTAAALRAIARRLGTRLLLGFVPVCVAACGGPAASRVAWRQAVPIADSQFVHADADGPATFFDGEGGSIWATRGWSRVHRAEDSRGSRYWVALRAQPAEILYRPPREEAIDLFLDCDAEDARASRPRLTLRFGESEASTSVSIAFRSGVNRIPIPAQAPTSRLARITLSMETDGVPAAVPVPKGADRLPLICRRMAVLPRRVADAEAYLATLRSRRSLLASRDFRVSPDQSYEIPLPPATEATLAIEDLQVPAGCALEIARIGGAELAVASLAESAGRRTIRIPAQSTLGRIRLRARSTRSAACPAEPAIRFALAAGTEFSRAGNARPWRTTSRPDLLVVLVDTLRADALVDLENGRPTAPGLRDFAEGAALFTNVWAPSTWTLPSVASLMTGVLPHRHGIMRGERGLRATTYATLAQELRDSGYQTLGITQSQVVGADFGFDRGFDRFIESIELNGRELRSQDLRGLLIAWIESELDPERPWFAYLHAVDPHGPYTPAEGARRRSAGIAPAEARVLSEAALLGGRFAGDSATRDRTAALYFDETDYVDRQMGLLVDELRLWGLWDSAATVLTADHGEELGEHGGFGHGRTLYDEQLRIPLVLHLPGSRTSEIVRARVSLLDLFPTLLRLAGSPPVAGLDGRDLAGPIAGEASADRAVFAEVHPAPAAARAEVDLFAAASGDAKCILNLKGLDQFGAPQPKELYFRASSSRLGDPGDGQDETSRRICRPLLVKFVRDSLAARQQAMPPGPEASELLEQLRALGYIR